MKQFVFILSSLLVFFTQKAVSLEQEFIKCQKNYIQPSQIFISDHEIFVEMEDVTLSVGAIHSDTNGLYFDSLMASIDPFGNATQGWFDYLLPWQCENPLCMRWNKPFRLVCKYCRFDRPNPNSQPK